MKNNMLRLGMVATALLVASSSASAQQQLPSCDTDAHRAFDFWVGDWDVTVVTTGGVAGTNTITKILNDCVLLEEYATPGGYSGKSYNAYDRSTGMWNQTWVDNVGQVLKLEGGIEDGKMVMSGPGRDQQGNQVINRITWTPHEDGSVQQTWDTSSDGGETWTNSFDGLYKKKAGS